MVHRFESQPLAFGIQCCLDLGQRPKNDSELMAMTNRSNRGRPDAHTHRCTPLDSLHDRSRKLRNQHLESLLHLEVGGIQPLHLHATPVGVEPGDRLCVSPLDVVTDGMQVAIIDENPTSAAAATATSSRESSEASSCRASK